VIEEGDKGVVSLSMKLFFFGRHGIVFDTTTIARLIHLPAVPVFGESDWLIIIIMLLNFEITVVIVNG